MQLNDVSMKKVGMILSVIFIPILLFLVLFGYTEVIIEGQDGFTLNNKDKSSPWGGYLFIGTHQISTNTDGYQNISKKITVKPGKNIFYYKLKTKKEIFVESLPVYNKLYDVDYNNEEGFFFVNIKTENIEEAKKDFFGLLKENDIDPNEERVMWDFISGINGRTGP